MVMQTSLGLDISTHYIGVAALWYDESQPFFFSSEPSFKLWHLGLNHIKIPKSNLSKTDLRFKKYSEKAREAVYFLINIRDEIKAAGAPVHICVESPAAAFSGTTGFTLQALSWFNGAVSSHAEHIFQAEASFQAPSRIRSLIGLKISGPNQKQAAFNKICEYWLPRYEWPKKRTGTIVDWAADEVDAYAVARAGIVEKVSPQKTKSSLI